MLDNIKEQVVKALKQAGFSEEYATAVATISMHVVETFYKTRQSNKSMSDDNILTNIIMSIFSKEYQEYLWRTSHEFEQPTYIT